MTQQEFNNSLLFIQSILNNDLVPELNTLKISGTVPTDTMDSIITHENTIISNLNNLITSLPTLKGDQGIQGIQGLKGDSGLDGISGSGNFLLEYIVPSACSSVGFSGLDLSLHKSYSIELLLKNPSGVVGNINMYINGDSVATNYYSIVTNFSGTSTTNNFPLVSVVDINSESYCLLNFSLISGRLLFNSRFIRRYSDTSAINQACSGFKRSLITNLTELTFASNVLNSIGVGSIIRIYRGDL